MTDLAALKAANAARWLNARLTRNFTSVARSLVESQAKARYQLIEKRTGVPWWFTAVVHEREASQRWDRQLGQGDPLDRVSVHDPAGRGPFRTFEDGAVDALVNCPPFAARNKDWSIGGLLTLLEQYNGLGYAARGLPSPYIWSGTDQYKSGKYIRDHVFDPHVIDVQLGCAGLLIAMAALDRSISIGGKMSPVVVPIPPIDLPDVHPPEPKPSISNPAKGSIGAFIASIFAAIFRRKTS